MNRYINFILLQLFLSFRNNLFIIWKIFNILIIILCTYYYMIYHSYLQLSTDKSEVMISMIFTNKRETLWNFLKLIPKIYFYLYNMNKKTNTLVKIMMFTNRIENFSGKYSTEWLLLCTSIRSLPIGRYEGWYRASITRITKKSKDKLF